jgi:hypothetical protein
MHFLPVGGAKMNFRLVGGAEDAFPFGRRSRRCISVWSEEPKMHFRLVGDRIYYLLLTLRQELLPISSSDESGIPISFSDQSAKLISPSNKE